MTSNFHSFLALTLLILLLLSPSYALPQPPHGPPSFTKIYAFGDSFTDTGNTVSTTGPSGFTYVSNPPYGMTYFHHPMNRYSDGRLIIDFVTQSLSLPLLPPYKSTTTTTKVGPTAAVGPSGGVNFAVAGSTAIEHEFFVKNNLTFDITPESLGTQLGWFDKVLEGQGCSGRWSDRVRCGAVLDDALIWVGEIGANDYAYSAESPVSKTAVQRLAIRRISGFLEAVLNRGAKYMIVQGLPPTGCLTLSMLLAPTDDRDELGCVKSQNKLSFNHNILLQAEIQNLRKRFPQSTILYADYYSAYSDIKKNMAKYGFKEAFKVCCGTGEEPYNYDFFSPCGSSSTKACSDPSQYINWDGVHLTEAMNKVVSGLLLQGGYSHPSFQYLLSRKKNQG